MILYLVPSNLAYLPVISCVTFLICSQLRAKVGYDLHRTDHDRPLKTYSDQHMMDWWRCILYDSLSILLLLVSFLWVLFFLFISYHSLLFWLLSRYCYSHCMMFIYMVDMHVDTRSYKCSFWNIFKELCTEPQIACPGSVFDE